jgi:hypothetical protein
MATLPAKLAVGSARPQLIPGGASISARGFALFLHSKLRKNNAGAVDFAPTVELAPTYTFGRARPLTDYAVRRWQSEAVIPT